MSEPTAEHEKVIVKNSDGVVTEEATMLGGLLDGETILYSSGRVVGRLHFKQGKQEGESVFYDDAGRVTMKSLYHDGKLNGEGTFFDENGKIIRKENYKDGQLHGRRSDFYPTGKAREVAHYQQGLPHGELIRLAPDGQIQEIVCYVKGRKVPCPPQVAQMQQKQAKVFQTKKLITG